MTTIASGHRIDVGLLKRLYPSAVTKASPEQIARLDEAWKNQFRVPVGPADNDPGNVYATVRVNGQVVATLYNSGGAMTSNANGAQLSALPSMGEGETSTGPVLARKRAEEIAKALGGTIEKASTAQTQAQWQQRPAMQWTYDYAAMSEAMAARNARVAASEMFVQAQIAAQSGGA